MAQYRAVNAKAEQAASQPFQKYSDSPDAFVAPMTGTQVAGQQGINTAQGMYQPSFTAANENLNTGLGAANTLYGQSQGLYGNALDQEQGYQNYASTRTNAAMDSGAGYIDSSGSAGAGAAATGKQYLGGATNFALAGAQSVNPTALGAAQIGQYMSPYNDAVVQSTMANLRQQQGQEQSSLQGDQIMRGSFGGSRAQLGRANLARQQDLASGQVLSGLENQNYSQALGAAQQQQGVGLGAAQANRSALQQTGQSMAALGQQGYEQGMGVANLQSQLGQQSYGQQMGNAQELAALGQQGFGAISQAGQNLQGLGAARFGQGLAASQQNAALGTGATQNELALRQAQMGAGTVEQQTQQAGLQAMYNQFLQQQGYPFQTSQFLAGIAGITGPNSGSTTYSTQPAPFFGSLSDKRAKADIEPIGETYDGQKIVRYRYKGRPERQIGLIAQDVEKHHPLAVHRRGGMRYVDYGRATEDAAERGHFADGGSANMDLGDILRMHSAMYPYGSEYGSPHTGGGTGPHGMALLQMRPAKLLQADAPKIHQGDGALHDLANTAKDVESLEKSGKGAYDAYQKATGPSSEELDKNSSDMLSDALSKMPDSSPSLTPDQLGDADFARGGMALGRARRKAGGSLPFSTDDSYVPQDVLDEQDSEESKLKAAQAPDMKGMKGTGSQILDAGKDIAKIAAMFAGGGRIRKAGAGGVEGDDLEGAIDHGGGDDEDYRWKSRNLKSNSDTFLNEALGAVPHPDAKYDPIRGRDYSADNSESLGDQARGVLHSVLKPIDYINRTMGRTPPELRYPDYSPPPDHAGSSASSQAPSASAALGAASTAPRAPAPAPHDVDASTMLNPGLKRPQASLRDPDAQVTPGADSEEGRAAIAASSGQPGPKREGWFGRNQDWLVPLLKGVGTMAGSNSRFLGTAMLQGLAGGAGSYEDIQNQLASRAKTNMGTQSQAADIAGDAFNKPLGAVRTYQNGKMEYVPWNKFYEDFLNGKKYQLAPLTDQEKRAGVQETGAPSGDQGQPSAAAPGSVKVPPNIGTPPGQNDDLPASEKAAAEATAKKMMTSNPGFDMSRYANQPQMSPYADIKAAASASYAMDPQLKELSAALSHLSTSKQGGPVSERLAELSIAFNDAFSHMGVNYQITPDLLANAQEVNKITGMLAQGAAQAGNQHAYAAIEQALQTVPRIINSPEAQRKLAADILVQQQRVRDLDNYATKYKDHVTQVTHRQDVANYSGEEVQSRFHQAYDAHYGADRDAIEKMMGKSVADTDNGVQKMPFIEYLRKYGRNANPQVLDAARQRYGADTVNRALRYFGM